MIRESLHVATRLALIQRMHDRVSLQKVICVDIGNLANEVERVKILIGKLLRDGVFVSC